MVIVRLEMASAKVPKSAELNPASLFVVPVPGQYQQLEMCLSAFFLAIRARLVKSSLCRETQHNDYALSPMKKLINVSPLK
jgi:hypothetical protein